MSQKSPRWRTVCGAYALRKASIAFVARGSAKWPCVQETAIQRFHFRVTAATKGGGSVKVYDKATQSLVFDLSKIILAMWRWILLIVAT